MYWLSGVKKAITDLTLNETTSHFIFYSINPSLVNRLSSLICSRFYIIDRTDTYTSLVYTLNAPNRKLAKNINPKVQLFDSVDCKFIVYALLFSYIGYQILVKNCLFLSDISQQTFSRSTNYFFSELLAKLLRRSHSNASLINLEPLTSQVFPMVQFLKPCPCPPWRILISMLKVSNIFTHYIFFLFFFLFHNLCTFL